MTTVYSDAVNKIIVLGDNEGTYMFEYLKSDFEENFRTFNTLDELKEAFAHCTGTLEQFAHHWEGDYYYEDPVGYSEQWKPLYDKFQKAKTVREFDRAYGKFLEDGGEDCFVYIAPKGM